MGPDDLVVEHRGLAAYLARRFARRGEPLEDLEQVALVGLWKAARRFDPGRGARFATYATVTVVGELKRHLRDRAWAVRPPRRLQERYLEVARAAEELGQRHGRSPAVAEVAAHLGFEPEDVVEALEAGRAFASVSLDAPPDPERPSAGAGADDPGFARADDRALVEGLLARLPAREQEVLRLRFFEHRTQNEIAARVGVSQVHVSRLLARSLATLRALRGA